MQEDNEGVSLDAVPATLYHYTTRAGLLGILGSASLYAGHIDFMNDPTEGRYADELAASLELPGGPIGRGFYAASYVVSFSEDGDLLSQWQSYGERGRGYALGFDLTGLGTITSNYGGVELNTPQKGPLQRVIYDRAEQIELLTTGLVSGEKLRGATFERIKHPSYAEEREWRLFKRYAHPFSSGRSVEGAASPTKFVPHAKGLKPIVPVALAQVSIGFAFPNVRLAPDGSLPLTEIVCGWQSSSEEALAAIELLLLSHNYTSVAVVPSGVPLVA